jgi:hypothetical protein
MSGPMMLLWIEKVLKPYINMAPTGIFPLLFLDSYQVHKMSSMNATINDLCMEVIIIPPGCTGLTQPVNFSFNKPFKNHVWDNYEEWMMEDKRDLTVPPHWIDVARWVVAAEKDMTTKIQKNAWNWKGLEYFLTNNNTEMAGGNMVAGGMGEGCIKSVASGLS